MLAESGMLYSKLKYEHSYPFCWRCDTPLLYYAMDSWFIKTTAIKDQLIANNNEVEWFPGHVREGRFGKFLEDLVDWNISRDRYWGTPLNIWVCEETGEQLHLTVLRSLELVLLGMYLRILNCINRMWMKLKFKVPFGKMIS